MFRLLALAAIIAAAAALAACTEVDRYAANRDWESLSKAMHGRIYPSGPRSLGGVTEMDRLLQAMRIDRIGIDDLTELKNRYYSDFVEPMQGDAVTDGLDRLIERKIGRMVRLVSGGRSYAPTVTFVIRTYDPVTYQGRLENGFADDSLHIREFPEAFGQRFVAYRPGDSIKIPLDSRFRFLVAPRSYRGHSWEVVDLGLDERGSFKLRPDLGQSLVFAIIAADTAPKRQYKVVWALGFGGMPSR